MPPLGPSPQANVSTPEKVELLLSPIRAPNKKKSPIDVMKVTIRLINSYDINNRNTKEEKMKLKFIF